MPADSAIRSTESSSTFLNSGLLKLCLATAIDIIPPARAAMKYASISNMPCVMYFNTPMEYIEK